MLLPLLFLSSSFPPLCFQLFKYGESGWAWNVLYNISHFKKNKRNSLIVVAVVVVFFYCCCHCVCFLVVFVSLDRLGKDYIIFSI